MKLFVLAAFVSLCADNAITLISEDNSNYVEGESRFVWIPDDGGVLHLVDLAYPEKEAVEALTLFNAENEYWLYTRQNPTNAEILKNGDSAALKNSTYSPNKGSRVISHGWLGSGDSELNPTIRDAILEVEDVNVIVLDWQFYSHQDYVLATIFVPTVGRQLGEFLVWLISTAGGDWKNVHLIGHSLGADVVGIAGHTVGGKAARVTGLDPASIGFTKSADAIDKLSGFYVEVMHTTAGFFGIREPVAHADFYPNGGHTPQPGCLTNGCSHNRSWKLFASSVCNNHFVGRLCATEDDAHNNKCNGTTTLNMGNDIITKQGRGMYGLTTGYEYPY